MSASLFIALITEISFGPNSMISVKNSVSIFRISVKFSGHHSYSSVHQRDDIFFMVFSQKNIG